MLKFTCPKIFKTGLFCLLLFVDMAAAQSNNDNHNNPLYVDPATHNFSENPELLDRILAGPHGYFRFINIQFIKVVCNSFKDALPGTPSFNLHGDAHIEQYAGTDLGRGLTDFDHSTTGPGIIDLIRFGVSLHLTCKENGWESKTDDLIDIFLLGYRTALNEPKAKAEIPTLVEEIQSKFTYNRDKYLEWIASLMDPMPAQEAKEIVKAMKPYVESMILQDPHLSKKFFDIKEVGYLRMGIGSALDIKYLARVAGHSDDPSDDVVLEIKEVRDLSAIECLTSTQKADPFRILVGQARISYQQYNFLGYLRFRDRAFWVHSWVDNYKEVKVNKSFKSVEKLSELVYDVGVQLGLGHPKHIAAPFDVQVRREQLLFLSKYDTRIKETCGELTAQTVEAWKLFKEKVENPEG